MLWNSRQRTSASPRTHLLRQVQPEKHIYKFFLESWQLQPLHAEEPMHCTLSYYHKGVSLHTKLQAIMAVSGVHELISW